MKTPFSPRTLFRDNFGYTGQSLLLAWKSSPQSSMAIVVLTIASAAFPLAVAYVGKLIIDAIVAGNREAAIRWVVAEFAIVGSQSLVQRSLFLMRSLLGAKLGTDINVMILEKALTLELRHFENSEFYDQLSRARREASSRPVSMVTDTLQLFQNVLTLGGYVGLLLAFSGWAVLGLVLASLPATFAEMKFSNAAFRLRNWRSPEGRKLFYVEHVLADDGYVKEVKTLGIGSMLLERYRSLSNTFYTEDKQLSVKRSLWSSALSLLATIAFYVCYVVMAIAAATGKMTLGNLTLYVVAFRQGQQAFQSCLTAVGGMYEHNLYMSNLFKYFSIPVEAKQVAPVPIQSSQGCDIELDNVGFKYPSKESWALRNISLKIPQGQILALVGHNGAGKSTLIKLLCGLYEPTEGRILFGGKDLREWNKDELRERLAVVFQDFNQYQFTFKENVGIGDVAHIEDEAQVMRAVERGGASEVLSELREGLGTQLGHGFYKGTQLSGGQWQKIALARAFMREQASVLILDEPTAALDAEAEEKVFDRFRLLAKGKTAILISHRFPTVRMADRICVIENGGILESGTHESLLAANGRYAQLFQLQAKGYL